MKASMLDSAARAVSEVTMSVNWVSEFAHENLKGALKPGDSGSSGENILKRSG